MGLPGEEFCSSETERAEEQQDQMEFDNALLAVRIQQAEEQGWECLVAVYSEIISIGTCPAPEFGLEGTGEAYRRTTAFLNFSCCGVIDLDTPFDQFPLCIQGPERTCEDGVTAEECAARCNGVHHPGETCEDEPCNPPGACCECPIYTLAETNPGGFSVEQEAIDRADQVNAEVQAEVDLLEANGWECVGVEPAAVRYSPDNEVWEVLGATVQGRCCGSLGDVIEGSPAGGSISPNNICVQDENFVRNCVDGKTAEECAAACGTHHPGETCEDEPCNPPCEIAAENVGSGNTFDTEAEAIELRDENNALLPAIVAALEAAGWVDVTTSESIVFQNEEDRWQTDLAEVQGFCCGAQDEEQSPVHGSLYPCENPLP
jgi:hypothetical protein